MTRTTPTNAVAAVGLSVLLSSGAAVAQQGYVSYQGVNSVVYRAENRNIYALFESPTGTQLEEVSLLSQAPPASSAAPPYVRSDHVNSIVFSTAYPFHIYEIFQVPGFSWQLGNLSQITHTTNLWSHDPTGYVRSDGVNSVVFNDTIGNSIGEIFLSSRGGWQHRNLSALAGIPYDQYGAGPPAPYVRSDGYNSVVYTNLRDSHIYEIFYVSGTPGYGDLNYYSGAPGAAGDPHPYVRWEGYNCVLYRGYNGHVYELLNADTWQYGDLTYYSGVPSDAISDPHPYRRSDGYNSVVFKGYDFSSIPPSRHIYELFLVGDSWQYGDLSYYAGAPEAGPNTEPHPYVRNDGVNSVVYVDNYGHIIDLYLTDTWHYRDLTVESASHP